MFIDMHEQERLMINAATFSPSLMDAQLVAEHVSGHFHSHD
ncbi:hypothetical protein [Rhodococcus sp. IEGM 1408]|nr:hypothetical protein [Rhodococcus sp. IEGM 1408]MDV8000940.1 hypothetical protein [Rhodococcus sp. IEGM 1408]